MNLQRMFRTMDTQVFGEAYRIIVHSPFNFESLDALSNQKKLESHFDAEKNLLLNEPRGHRGMNGCIVGASAVADYQLLFLHHQEAINFKYEALLATTAALLEIGHLQRKKDGQYTVETVHGVWRVKAVVEQQEVTAVRMEVAEGKMVENDSEASCVKLTSGHMFYVYSLPASIKSLQLGQLSEILEWGAVQVKELKSQQKAFDGVILKEQLTEHEYRSVTFEQDGYILRSPGIESTIALAVNEQRTIGSLSNQSIFDSKIDIQLVPGDRGIFTVEGVPYITGSHEFILDPEDPLPKGFILA
ncbi:MULTISPECIES: proline racemase family protein [unclassified Sporosarcina]|uniref:proline racemase family protein n=1 Tax=unclassified Sporosarcina TaxID=2647733 RepID=UPI000C16512E|nr:MULTISPECIES: proline racemase family protein [unclassified Sporosarcina]PID06320.1 proline racemase [Sporosarcina sp. P30]PID09514.1 proline racemase [Sporosarcina sp. P31]PID12812.1 proline racemase [Sporosarcina sp. P32b]